MKKLNKLGILLSSIAMAAGVITFSGAKNQNKISFRSDEYYERTGDSKGFYEKHNLEPVEAMSFASYTDNPGSTNVFNDDKNWYLDPISVGNTWNTYRGDGVTIAVIDTGLRSQHEDFYYNSTGKYNISEDSACFTHTGGNYYGVSTTYVKNGGSLDWTVIENSSAGHGTNVTSTIASRINNKGTVGIAPNVNILFLKAATLYSDEVSEAIKYAADKYADIITMSLGCYSSSVIHGDLGDTDCAAKNIAYANGADSLYSTAINYAYGKGCMILASAGNEDVYSNSYPACNDHVIGVGALDKSSLTKKASYSNYNSTSASASGNHNVDVTAPGSVKVADKDSNTDYVETRGTSFSCPIVAGAMALYYQKNNYGGSTNVTTRKSNVTAATNALYNSCVDIGDTGWDRMYGYGALDISKLCGTDTTNVSSISVDKTSLTINEGFTKTATASISPIYSKNKFVNWTSSNSSVATVTSSTVTTAEATITGVSGGTCTITAKSADNASIYKTISVTVNGYVHSYFTATAKTDLTVGETTKINIDWDEGTPNDPSIMFDTSDEDVVTVDESGNVTAVGAGDGTIFIVSGDDEQEITFHVSEPVISSGPVVFTFGSNSGKDITSASGSATKNNVKVTAAGSGIEGGDLKVNGPTANAITVEGLSGVKITQVALSMTNDSQKWSADSGSFSNLVWTAASNAGVSCVRFSKGQGSGVKQSKVTQIEVTTLGGSTPSTSYTVSFNANGGSGTMNSQTTTGSFTVPSCTFTAPSGKEFDHWAIDSASGSTASGTISITKDTTLYAVWKDKTTGGGSSDSGTYYDSITETSGTKLLGQLHDLSVTKHTKYNTYSEISTTNCFKTDPCGTSSSYIRDFYSGGKMSNQIVSSGTNGWNREHLWCQSLSNGLWGESGGGADLQHLRPTIAKVNSDRGSKKYAAITGSKTASTYSDADGTTVTGGYYTSSYFEPIDAKKGDVARILMYTYMHYNTYSNVDGTMDGSTSSYFGTLNFTNVVSATNEEGAKQLLLAWNSMDPVDETETIRNTEAAKITGCRNPFIDHPEYATAIWGSSSTDATYDSLTYTGSPTKTTYNAGENFDPTGLTVTAKYTGKDDKNVTSSVVWTPSPLTAGTTSVTGTYTEGSVSHHITISGITVNAQQSGGSKTIKITRDSFSNSGGYAWYSWSSNGVSGQAYIYATESGKMQFNGGKDGKAIFSSTGNGVIESIKVKSQSGTPSWTLYGSNTPYTTSTTTSGTNLGSKNTSTSGVTWTPTQKFEYFSLVLGTSNAAYLSEIEVFYKDGSPKVSSISLDKEKLDFDLYNNATPYTLKADVVAEDGADTTITWESSNPSVATVENGKVTPLGVGTATITATAGGIPASCTVTVKDSSPVLVSNLTITSVPSSIEQGKTGTMVVNVEPSNATNKELTWTSSNNSILSVGTGTGSSMTITAVGSVGQKATITATAKDGSGKYASKEIIIVGAVTVTGYRLDLQKKNFIFMEGKGSVTTSANIVELLSSGNEQIVSTVDLTIFTNKLGTQTISYNYKGSEINACVTITNAGTQYQESSESNPTSSSFNLSNETNKKFTTNNQTVNGWTLTAGDSPYFGQSGSGDSGYNTFGSKNDLFSSILFTHELENNQNFKEVSIKLCRSGTDLSNNLVAYYTDENGNVTDLVLKSVKDNSGNTPSSTDIPVGTSVSSMCTFTFGFSANRTNKDPNKVYTLGTSKAKVTIGIDGSSGKKQLLVNNLSYVYTTGVAADNDFNFEQQAKSWAQYFIDETRTADTCLAANDSLKLAGLSAKWSTLSSEYAAMVSGSKDLFCTSNDETIATAREHYKYIVKKFGNDGLSAFVTDGSDKTLSINSNKSYSLINIEDKTSLIVVITLISVTSLGLYFYLKRKKEIE